jgi:diguanylate cyclase (GGDEF)-like protein
MATKASAGGQSAPEFRLRVLLPVVVVTLGAVILSASGLYWATTSSDAVSIERQTKELRNAIKTGIDEVVQSQKMVAIWDQAVLQLREEHPDWDWVDNNMAIPLRISFGHSQFYVLNGNDDPLYAMHEGARIDPALYDFIKDAVRPLVDTVRGGARAPPMSPDAIGLPPATTIRNGDGLLYAAGLLNLFRRPAAVSVMRNIPLTDNVTRTPGKGPLIISIRFLDSLFRLQLSSRYLIDAPRFSRTPDLQPDEQELELVGDRGDLIGYVYWRPELPGTTILRALAPITAVTVGMMILIMTLLGRWLYRSMREQRAMMEELKAREAEAQQLALRDALTGLANRIMLDRKVDETLARGQQAALLLLDLDRFKHVNDAFGHAAGDMLIRQFADRITGLVRESDIVARLGGDEFAILSVERESAADIEALCQRIVDTVGRPFILTESDVFVGVSIGVCPIPTASANRIDIMRKADIALYRAKAEGRNCYRLFTPDMDETVKMRGVLEGELRAALASGEGLAVHYQPEVRCLDEVVIGVEALMRWQHPSRGLIPPSQFIAVAEETGLIRELGEYVLREGCAASLRWPNLFIAINLSPVQLRMPDFASRVIAIVGECGADPHRIELEVTESVFLDDSSAAQAALEKLRTAGFQVALDDFGTGYSSLSYLRQFDVDKIKIDRSFIHPVWYDAAAASIVTALLTLGHAMGLTVVAEGVETAEQRQFLIAAGCDVMQGHFFSPAVPMNEIEQILAAATKARGAA